MNKNKLRTLYDNIGLPRIIIFLFLIILCICMPILKLQTTSLLAQAVTRIFMNMVLVLAMVPSIECGIGMNYGLPLGVLCGLFGGMISSWEWDHIIRDGQWDDVNTLAMVLGIPLLKLALGLTGGAILIAVLMKYLPDSVLMRRVTNATVSGGPAGEAVNIARVQVGDRGNAVTELKPNGKAMIHGEICEVFSRQGILIKGTPVRVVDIRPFDLVVVKDESPSGD